MKSKAERIQVSTKGHSDVIDITERLTRIAQDAGITSGTMTVFVVGSTAALTTIEFEPGLVHDIKAALERIAPVKGEYQHHERWGDDNGHSHIRASLIGPSLVVPIVAGKLPFGTWQQAILIDFDTGPRNREIIVQMIGI